mgnify:CR=1 FL=1
MLKINVNENVRCKMYFKCKTITSGILLTTLSSCSEQGITGEHNLHGFCNLV